VKPTFEVVRWGTKLAGIDPFERVLTGYFMLRGPAITVKANHDGKLGGIFICRVDIGRQKYALAFVDEACHDRFRRGRFREEQELTRFLLSQHEIWRSQSSSNLRFNCVVLVL
jgi:hypothetical protein